LAVLDGLRGIAILAVIVCHINNAYGGPYAVGRLAGPLATVFGWGWAGVDLFFVMSGFLITGILYAAKGGRGYFRNFYARRMLRIMPLYYGFLFLTIVVLPRVAPGLSRGLAVPRSDALALVCYVYNFRQTLGGPFLPAQNHFWSLSIEEQYYLFWPVIVAVLERKALMRLCVVAAATSILLRTGVILWTHDSEIGFCLTPFRLDALLAGSWVALARQGDVAWAWCRRCAAVLTCVSALLFLVIGVSERLLWLNENTLQEGESPVMVAAGLALLAVCFSGTVVLAVESKERGVGHRLLSNRFLCTIGKYSYGMYVFHLLIRHWGIQLAWPLASLPTYVSKPVGVVWLTAFSFGVAWGSYYLFERHFLRLKRFFEYRGPATPATLASRDSSNEIGGCQNDQLVHT
jgi:peptidoglycan/LPS O-acetylase OafA/YrhL